MATYKRIQELCKNSTIVSGALHPECIYLIAEEKYNPKKHGKSYDEWSFTGDFSIFLYKPLLMKKGNDWQADIYEGMKKMRTVAVIPQRNVGFCGVFFDGDVIVQDTPRSDLDDVEWIENAIHNRGDRAITDVAVIDDEVYASAGGGAVYKRITDNNWQEIATSQTQKFFDNKNFSKGFYCIAGFSANEIYAGCKDGVVWLCDNGSWSSLSLPTDTNIKQIICADNGVVYMLGNQEIIIGRKDKWQVIHIDVGINANITAIAYFKNTLYVLLRCGLYTMSDDNRLHEIHASKNISIPNSRYASMTANDDLLLLTDTDRAIIFNGERWFVIFDKNQSEEQLRQQGVFYDPREL